MNQRFAWVIVVLSLLAACAYADKRGAGRFEPVSVPKEVVYGLV